VNPDNMDRCIARTSVAAALSYALLAGLRTMSDFDVWWQMAGGRWLAETGEILRRETFSYTAAGAPWMYPQAGGLLFHLAHRAGGEHLLSLLAPLAAVITAAILLRGGGVLRAWLVALAVPAIAWRTAVRAEMFTTALAAVFLVALWRHHRGEKAPLAALPVLMLAWVNLHPGFILGVALALGFAARHPRSVGPYALLTLLATLVNPWGARIWEAIAAQGRAMEYQQAFLGEWSRVPLSAAALLDALRVRDPDSSYWMLLAMAAAGVAAALWRRRLWGALLLAGAAAGSLVYLRFQTMFAITAAALVPDLLAIAAPRRCATAVAAAALLLFTGVRSADLLTNRYYLTHGELAAFGTGVSPWFPQRAVAFLRQHRLPAEVYHDYNLGGYLTWAIIPQYRVFIDGRALPYGPELFFLQQSPEWRTALERWNVNTVLVSTARFGGYGVPLRALCDSAFDLVYLDDAAAIFARRGRHQLPALSCKTAPVEPSAGAASFHYWANAGKLYYALERDAEADAAWQKARAIFDDDPSLHLDLGQLRHAQGRLPEAEREFRRAIALRGTPTAWYALGDLLLRQGRFAESAACFRESAARSAAPHEARRAEADAWLGAGQPQRALDAAHRALDASPFRGPAASMGRGFTARALLARAAALLALHRAPEAQASLDAAWKLGPQDVSLRLRLHLASAEAASQQGNPAAAQQHLESAEQLRSKR
jgi:tetratricopeptide (TPR) repeat protein